MRVGIRLGLAAAFLLVVSAAAFAGLNAGRERAERRSSDMTPVPAGQGAGPDTDRQIADLQARIARRPPSAQTYTGLGVAYLQKARESGDPSYYSRADAALKQALDLDAEDADTAVGLGTLALARHQFEQALAVGEHARVFNPYRAAAYGVIGDAQIELGRYDEAAAAIQAMVNLRPDLSSYARVSYLRELRGDVPGAVEAMRRAVTAGTPGTEARAWSRVQLGHLYFNGGNLAAAEAEYARTLVELPDYLHARAGLARVAAARGDYATAIRLYDEITKGIPLPEYAIALAEVHRAAGNTGAAARAEGLVQVIDRLYRENAVDTDVEMALFSADHDLDLPDALARAHRAYDRRPSIHAADVLAWTLYKTGRPAEAEPYAREALRLGTQDALKLYHAGMIARALGRTEQARAYLAEALRINPHFSLLHAPAARAALTALGGDVSAPGVEGSQP